MKEQNEIILRREAGNWVAEQRGPMAAEVLSLFGTTRIRTPYMAELSSRIVLAQIQARNPGVLVRVEE